MRWDTASRSKELLRQTLSNLCKADVRAGHVRSRYISILRAGQPQWRLEAISAAIKPMKTHPPDVAIATFAHLCDALATHWACATESDSSVAGRSLKSALCEFHQQ